MSYFIGLISGTSMDAVDAALVDFADDRPSLIVYRETPFPAPLRAALHAARRQGARLTVDECGDLDVDLGRLFAEAALGVLSGAGVQAVDVAAIGSHGQTLLHRPAGARPYTLQIGDPNIIAAVTGITTVSDFRRMDLAAGGQGAPLAPAFHAAIFRDSRVDRVVVNIGGIANITILPAEADKPVSGFDTGPGNALLDDWAYWHLREPMDRDGLWARSGQVSAPLLEWLLADPYFSLPPPKSTGREHFNLNWLDERLAQCPTEPADVQATLIGLTAASIAGAIRQHAAATGGILVCGGGARNPALMVALAAALPQYTVQSTMTADLAPECVEAVMFAWLAKRRMEGLAGNLPGVTGARRRVILGGVYLPPRSVG